MITDEPICWAGGEHRFELNIKELRILQERCDAGPEHVSQRLMGHHGGWRMDDVIQPLRLGLMGAGMEPAAAAKIVQSAIEEGGAMSLAQTAYAVLINNLLRPEDDPAGEDGAGEVTAESPPTLAESGDSPSS